MKKFLDCKLRDIHSIEDATYEDYELYDAMRKANKHPFLNGFLIFGAIVTIGAIVAMFVVTSFNPGLALPCLLAGASLGGIPLCGGIQSVCEELNTYGYALKQYRSLKKSKDWKRVETIMEEYEKSEKFKADKHDYEIQKDKKLIEQKEIEIATQKTQIEKLDEEISIIKKRINGDVDDDNNNDNITSSL